MLIQIMITLDVGEQDSTKEGIETAQSWLYSMGVKDIIDIAHFEKFNNE